MNWGSLAFEVTVTWPMLIGGLLVSALAVVALFIHAGRGRARPRPEEFD